MEGLVNVLKNLQGVMQKGLTNLKKSPKDRLTLEYIETKLELLEKDWSSYVANNTKLHELYVSHDSAKIMEMYDSTEDTYITYKCVIKAMLNKFNINKATTKDDREISGNTNAFKSLVQLPKICIPTFTGNYSEWTTFRDLFVSLVHKNDNLDNVQKMHYLKSHLGGEAEQLVRHTPVSDSNYAPCWAHLEKRYNNKRYLVNCILKRLFGIKRMQVESAIAIKELLDTTNDCLSALSNQGVNVTTWDIIIIHIVTFKLDAETRKQWELSISSNDSMELPTFSQFSTFLGNRFRALEFIEPKKVFAHQVNRSIAPKAMVAVNDYIRCEFCSEAHKLCFCKEFIKQTIDFKRDFVAKNRICFNCLGGNHNVLNCKKPTCCKLCGKRHHSLLHLGGDQNKGRDTPRAALSNTSPSTTTTPVVSSHISTNQTLMPRQVLLATALIKAESKTGDYMHIRALVDQGSQACFITEATVQLLALKKIPIQGIVSGIGHKSTMARHMVQLKIHSRLDPGFELKINAYILKKITSYLPEHAISSAAFDWIDKSKLKLADPQFYQPNKIDILLGADAYSGIIKEGMLKNPSRTLIAQSTTLGWILSGVVENLKNKSKEFNISVNHAQFMDDQILRQFWEIEEHVNNKRKILSPEEQRCEEKYCSTTRREDDGRYIVRLPFRDEHPPCVSGRSRAIAEARFKSLEKRFKGDKNLKEKYTEVMNEYIQLGHMKLVEKDDDKKDIAVYLPHHAVIRDDKTTTKVRVVFNASQKNNNGISLNDTLMIGPTLQAELRHTVMKWRVHVIGIVADIVKMYRQVRVAAEDTMFQRILWRDNPQTEIKDYELVTITFGTASAPYQAVRTLHQIVYDEGDKYPLVAEMVLNCFYMDDFMSGCVSVEDGVEIYKQMTELLQKGGFVLQKWNSNNEQLLDKIKLIELEDKKEGEHIDQSNNKNTIKNSTLDMKNQRTEINENKNGKDINIKTDSTMKILGLAWDRNNDTFQYSVNLPPLTSASVTKRTVISDIARLFDPLGWLAPSIVLAKIFIQKLWITGVGWDEELSPELFREWSTYREELSRLREVQISRWLGIKLGDDLELHGFCDASKAAYSAVVYLRIVDSLGQVNSMLVVAKTRVAPVKQVSIPRLELCGAVLLSNLLVETAEVLNISQDKIIAWTDSTIVLAWLHSHPSKWKTFVANRTSEILTSMRSTQWFHVSTKENPADCASRGLPPSLFINNTMWFSGPNFLKQKLIEYKRPKDLSIDLEQSIKAHIAIVPENSNFMERFSSLSRLLRVVAYCRRFLYKGKHNKYLHKQEIDQALECCIKKTQREIFTVELIQIKDKGYIQSKSSKLKSLCTYLDNKDIMRVQGRLQKSLLDEQTKHPIVLPHNAHFTYLLVADAHNKTLHGGPQLVINYLRTAYWIIGVRNLVKQFVRKCVTCAKQRANIKNQMMGSLPSVRCTPARPFLHSGVDYAGPINIRTTRGRGHRSYKGYICLFVCMATRALHLEVVSDMSTQAFLAAFKRFVARRGHCAKLWSDNGTTFVGASRELKQLISHQSNIAEHLEANGTEWHFIPPHAPNFGGLWEAGVKSTKYHLKRVIGDSTLTYEELTTLLNQIEACLNSRPMSVANVEDPGEPLPLTPGHFLIGEPLVNVPDYNFESSAISTLSRWQFVQRMVQSFWKRWSQEYIANLMNRYKWSSKVPEPEVGNVVLIKEDDLPPSRWLLGRIVEKHPGDDNVTRVVTLRTKSSIMKRPTNKLCILPISD